MATALSANKALLLTSLESSCMADAMATIVPLCSFVLEGSFWTWCIRSLPNALVDVSRTGNYIKERFSEKCKLTSHKNDSKWKSCEWVRFLKKVKHVKQKVAFGKYWIMTKPFRPSSYFWGTQQPLWKMKMLISR